MEIKEMKKMFDSSLDIVIVIRKDAALMTYDKIESAILHLGKLHNIINM